MNRNRLIKTLVEHEGVVLKPYKCTAGKLTIGIGRNLEDVGITEEEAFYLLENDIKRVVPFLVNLFDYGVFDVLSDVRQEVLINMCYNLGKIGFSKFKNLIKAINELNFDVASDEMMDSKWYRQVGNRAKDLCYAMKYNEFYDE